VRPFDFVDAWNLEVGDMVKELSEWVSGIIWDLQND
jgi:hypothetical protein